VPNRYDRDRDGDGRRTAATAARIIRIAADRSLYMKAPSGALFFVGAILENGILTGMTELDRLQGKPPTSTERAASRKLARSQACPKKTPCAHPRIASAGQAGLAACWPRRTALRAAEAQRVRATPSERAPRWRCTARHDGAASAWRAWFDGSARPNPGRCGIGARLEGPGGELIELSEAAGYGNSSEAEYLRPDRPARGGAGAAAPSTSRSTATAGRDRRRQRSRIAFAAAAWRPCRAACTPCWPAAGRPLRWVPRHKNMQADALSQRAFDLHHGTRCTLNSTDWTPGAAPGSPRRRRRRR
jgi:ribonuclease HI